LYHAEEVTLSLRDGAVVKASGVAAWVVSLKQEKLSGKLFNGNDREKHVYVKLNAVYSRVCPTGCNVKRWKFHRFHGKECKRK